MKSQILHHILQAVSDCCETSPEIIQSKCLSFWLTLAALWWADRAGWAECNIVAAILLSLAMAYLSNWFGILLVWLNHKYTDLWQRLNSK